MPNSPTRFAETIVKLVDTASPNKKKALETKHISASTGKRQATVSIVNAAASVMSSNKVVKKSLVSELVKLPSKLAVEDILPVSRATLNRKSAGK